MSQREPSEASVNRKKEADAIVKAHNKKQGKGGGNNHQTPYSQ